MTRASRQRSYRPQKNTSAAETLLNLFKANDTVCERNGLPAKEIVDRIEGRPLKPCAAENHEDPISIASELREARLRAVARPRR